MTVNIIVKLKLILITNKTNKILIFCEFKHYFQF